MKCLSMRTAIIYILLGGSCIMCEDRCAALQGEGLRPYNSFASPAYPGPYPPNQDCVRVVQARPGYDIKITFRDYFQIETSYDAARNVNDVTSQCPNDFVEFRDGRYGFSPLIGRFCGMSIPKEDIISHSGFLWIRFRSDDQLEYRGFLASIEMIRSSEKNRNSARECHIEQKHGLDGYIDTTKLLSSLSLNFGSSIDCVWQLAVPVDYQTVFYIHEFKLHKPNECEHNFLEVYSGGTSDSPLRRFCGRSASTVFSYHHRMFVRFYLADASYLNQTSIVGLYSAFARYKNCSAHNLLSCGDENCIPSALECNGRFNCPYGKDERNCHIAQDALLGLLLSSYFPLILIILVVFIVICNLTIWSCRSDQFCKHRKTSYADCLRDMSRQRIFQQSSFRQNGNGARN